MMLNEEQCCGEVFNCTYLLKISQTILMIQGMFHKRYNLTFCPFPVHNPWPNPPGDLPIEYAFLFMCVDEKSIAIWWINAMVLENMRLFEFVFG